MIVDSPAAFQNARPRSPTPDNPLLLSKLQIDKVRKNVQISIPTQHLGTNG